MELSAPQSNAITQLAKKFNLDWVRVFGSAVESLESARDVDVVYGNIELGLAEHEELRDELRKVFQKEIDLLSLARKNPTPTLILEIAARSAPIYESAEGREKYADLLIPLHQWAADEELSTPMSLRLEALNRSQKRSATS